MEPDAPQKPPGSSPLKWILLLFGCLMLGACGFVALLVGGIFGGVMIATQPPVDASKHHVDLVRGGQVEQAYKEMSTGYQASTSLEQFKQFVAANQALYTATELSFPNRNVSGSTARVTGSAKGPSGTVQVLFELEKEGESWRVTDVGPPE